MWSSVFQNWFPRTVILLSEKLVDTIMISQLAILSLISAVASHGTVSAIVADGILYVLFDTLILLLTLDSYQGYNPSYQYMNPAPIISAWSTPQDLDNGFISPASYGNADIICHKGATPGKVNTPIKAGGKVQFNWTPWPVSHKGPMISYLAACNGPCQNVDKTSLKVSSSWSYSHEFGTFSLVYTREKLNL